MEGELPKWLINLGTITALVLAVLQVLKIIFKVLEAPYLEVKLTKEVFFRLLMVGESIFANLILLARLGNIEVRDVNFTLTKTDGQSKSLKVLPRYIGKKIVDPNDNFAKNHFFSSTPLNFISPNKVERQIYISIVDQYNEKIEKKYKEYQNELEKHRAYFTSSDFLNKEEEDQQAERNRIVINQLLPLIQDTKSELFKLVQLEKGEYKLEVFVKYKAVTKSSGIWYKFRKPKLKTSTHFITFNVGEFEDKFKNDIFFLLIGEARNTLFPENSAELNYPSYSPEKIIEN